MKSQVIFLIWWLKIYHNIEQYADLLQIVSDKVKNAKVPLDPKNLDQEA